MHLTFFPSSRATIASENFIASPSKPSVPILCTSSHSPPRSRSQTTRYIYPVLLFQRSRALLYGLRDRREFFPKTDLLHHSDLSFRGREENQAACAIHTNGTL